VYNMSFKEQLLHTKISLKLPYSIHLTSLRKEKNRIVGSIRIFFDTTFERKTETSYVMRVLKKFFSNVKIRKSKVYKTDGGLAYKYKQKIWFEGDLK